MLVNEDWKNNADEVLEKLYTAAENLRDVAEQINTLLDLNDRISCANITTLVSIGIVPGQKFKVLDGDKKTIGIFTVVKYNADSLHCLNENQETINASYKAILKCNELNRIIFIDKDGCFDCPYRQKAKKMIELLNDMLEDWDNPDIDILPEYAYRIARVLESVKGETIPKKTDKGDNKND